MAELPGLARPRTGSSGRAHLLTVLGEFVLPHGRSMWTSTVITCLSAFDITEPNARQAAARTGEDGILAATRFGRSTNWTLTPRGTSLLTAGARRIYGFGQPSPTWDGRWLVVLAQIPEEKRATKLAVRNQLGFAGFGFPSPGVALSPHADREETARGILAAAELDPPPILFIGRVGSLAPEAEIIRRSWDLESLAQRYDGFLHDFGRLRPKGGQATFKALVDLVHSWRQFPFADPEIPSRLLPVKWPGSRAKQVFDDQRASWSPSAHNWYETVESVGSVRSRT